MDTARVIELVGALLVAGGAAFMLAAIATERRTARDIPPDLRRPWRWITGLMVFFLAGYLLFAAIILLRVPIPETPVAGAVFLGGAIFVFLVINLTRRTVQRARSAEDELRALNESLEQQVAERSHAIERRALQLQTTAEIARIAVQTPDPQDLMSQSVELIRDRFSFYHASIFTIDETGAWAELAASTGEAGRRMLSRNHRLAVGSASMVGWVTGNRLPRISNDVSRDPFHFKNPQLPDTRAELTLPMIVGGRLIGVLDVQSTGMNAFAEEDVRALEAITGELAIAIDSTRLVRETAEELKRAEGLVRGRARESWARFARAGVPTLLRVGGDGTAVPSAMGEEAARAGQTSMSADGREVAVPVQVRGEVVATIAARRGPGDPAWAKDDVAVLESVAGQIGLSLENARQYAEEQRRVSELEVVNRISQGVSQLLRLDSLFRVVYAQIGQVLPGVDVSIGLYDPAADAIEYPFVAEAGEFSQRPPALLGVDLAAQVLRTRQALLLTDDLLHQAEILGIGLPTPAPASWLGVPLLVGDSALGLLIVEDPTQAGRFTEDDLALLTTVAAQVATAIQNDRLLGQTQRAARRERLIREITSKVRRSPDIRTILDTTARELGRAFNATRTTVRLGSPPPGGPPGNVPPSEEGGI